MLFSVTDMQSGLQRIGAHYVLLASIIMGSALLGGAEHNRERPPQSQLIASSVMRCVQRNTAGAWQNPMPELGDVAIGYACIYLGAQGVLRAIPCDANRLMRHYARHIIDTTNTFLGAYRQPLTWQKYAYKALALCLAPSPLEIRWSRMLDIIERPLQYALLFHVASFCCLELLNRTIAQSNMRREEMRIPSALKYGVEQSMKLYTQLVCSTPMQYYRSISRQMATVLVAAKALNHTVHMVHGTYSHYTK